MLASAQDNAKTTRTQRDLIGSNDLAKALTILFDALKYISQCESPLVFSPVK